MEINYTLVVTSKESTYLEVVDFYKEILKNALSTSNLRGAYVEMAKGKFSWQVKELEKVKSNNFLLELIRVAIGDRMDQEVARLARRYDLDLIKEVVERLVNNAIELGQVTPKDGEAALEFILGFESCADERTDFNNKYKALHRAIRVSSFRQLRSRLERDAREQL